MTFIAYLSQKAKNVSARTLINHLEIILANPAVGALPVGWHILPARAGGDTILRPTLGLIINEATYHALPLLHTLIRIACVRTDYPARSRHATARPDNDKRCKHVTLCTPRLNTMTKVFMSIPDWQPATSHPHSPPSDLLDWLCDEGSLTRRLIASGQDDFRVEVLVEQQQPARADEAAALGLTARHPVWIREVLLHTAGAPRVFARTVADLQAFNAAGVYLENLGSRSLGELLFSDPRIRREPIEISPYPAAWLPAPVQAAHCWARRSLFSSERLQLLVCEVFLPGWPRPT